MKSQVILVEQQQHFEEAVLNTTPPGGTSWNNKFLVHRPSKGTHQSTPTDITAHTTTVLECTIPFPYGRELH